MSKRIERRLTVTIGGLYRSCLLSGRRFLDKQFGKRHPWMAGLMALGLLLSGLSSQAIAQSTIAQSTIAQSSQAKPALIVYPPPNHETSADRIFLIGSAPPAITTVTINGQAVRRSKTGNFAPSFPLQVGANAFTLKAGRQTLNLSVKRLPTTAADTLSAIQPDRDIVRRPGDWVCFGATAPKGAKVSVQLGDRRLDLAPIGQTLPENSAVLVNQNGPIAAADTLRGCTQFAAATSLVPQFQMVRSGGGNSQPVSQPIAQAGAKLQIVAAQDLDTIEVTADQGVARTGPSSDYSRLTPLPKGVRARIIAKDGDWIQLDYGGWIRASETASLAKLALPPSLIRSVAVRNQGDRTEVKFPLQMAVPIALDQQTNRLSLTLYNATAQTDTIRIGPDPIVQGLNWQQIRPGEIRYDLTLKGQQWGYTLRYEGSTLVLTLRHGPKVAASKTPNLKGVKIVLDPGHGGPEDSGSVGPTGYPEKSVALKVSQRLRQVLVARGATVVLTREADVDLGLKERMDRIQAEQPTLALSLHYNALPDQGDAIGTQGVAAFWYHDQAQGLAQSLHDALVKDLKRSSYGVFWNNLALTRPAIAPTVMLELGFMINPDEFEWIVDDQAQERLVQALANGIEDWVRRSV